MEIYILLKKKEVNTLDQGILSVNNKLKSYIMNRPIAFYKEHTPLDSKEIKPPNPKGNQPWIFYGRTDVEASILGLHDAKGRLIVNDPDAGKDWV